MLLTYEGTDGIKTGYIGSSGFNLVANVRRGDKHVIGVVFGGATAGSAQHDDEDAAQHGAVQGIAGEDAHGRAGRAGETNGSSRSGSGPRGRGTAEGRGHRTSAYR